MPKGKSEPDAHKFDFAIVRDEHTNHPNLLPFLMCTPPKLKLTPIGEIDSKEVFGKTLDKILEETSGLVGKFRESLTNKLETQSANIGEKALENIVKLNTHVETLTDKLNELTRSMDILKHEVDNMEKKVKPAPQVNKKGGAANLFENN
jgi:predicted RNase H-like nuclease (RuvC/YqgF family)